MRYREWNAFVSMATMRLNSQVQQYDGFTPGKRVFWRGPKLPIGAVGNPFFEYFMNPADAPTAETQNLISMIFEIRQAPLTSDFRNKLDAAFIRRVGNAKKRGYLIGKTVFFRGANRKK